MSKEIPQGVLVSQEIPEKFEKRIIYKIPVIHENIPKEISSYFENIVEQYKKYFKTDDVEIEWVKLTVTKK